MRRRPRRSWSAIASIAFAIAVSAGAASAQQTISGSGLGEAQGQAQGAATAAAMQSSAASSITSANASLIPGSSGDTNTLQSYQSNPAALGSAGAAAAANGSDALNATLAGQANANRSVLSNTDSWLQASLAIVADPTSVIKTTGAGPQSCTTTQTPVVTTTNDGTYTCETTQPVTDTTPSCTQNLIVDTSTAYNYACSNTYNQTTRQWVTSPACSTLASSSACSQTASTCTSGPQPYFTATQCTAGTEWHSTQQTCQSGSTSASGQSQCSQGTSWVTSSPSQCSQGTSWSTSSQACQAGTSYSPTNQVCTQNLNITVAANYNYTGNYTFNGTSWVNDGPQSALLGAGGVCQVTASNCTANSNPQTYNCTTGYSTAAAGQSCTQNNVVTIVGPYWTYVCTLDPTGQFPEDCQEFINNYNCSVTSYGTNPDNSIASYVFSCAVAVSAESSDHVTLTAQGYNGTNDNWGTCTQDGQAGCTNLGTVCLDSGGTRLVNGYYVTKSCWSRVTQYSCTATTNATGCFPPSGFTETASSCAATDPASGSCTETNQTWTGPSTCTNVQDKWTCTAPVPAAGNPDSVYRYISSESWSTTCGSLASNPSCSLSSDVGDGGGTRTINGLDVYRPSWAKTDTYACQGGTQINTCPTAPGCSQTGKTCAQNDPATGQCSLYNETYSCNNSSPVDTCTAQEGQTGCSVVSQTCSQNDPSTGACSLYNKTYSCNASTVVDTCTAQEGQPSCSVVSQTCAQNDPVTAACSLYNKTYSCAVSTAVNTCGPYSGCNQVSSTCAQTDATGACTLYNKTYACWTSQPVDGCTGNVNGCTQSGKTCAGTDASGACSVWTYGYSCPANDGSGGCGVKTNTYTCTTDVPPADPAQSVVTTQTGQHWDQTCPQDTDPTCKSQGATCSDANSAKVVNGISVTEGCWSQTTSYQCEALGAKTTNCDPPAGCVHDHDQCLDEPAPASGCVSMDHVYTCSNTTTGTATKSTCTANLCVGPSCFSVSGSSDSNNIGKAYAALSTAKQSGGDYANTINNLKIMSGTPASCAKSLTGFSNCCKDSGWGVGIGLASCSTKEKALIDQQKLKETHYVGTWCSNKSFFGICLEKSMRYCVFEGSLARIINEAGRTQISKPWGSGKSPDCSGFTVDQFASLDLSNVDFSDFYNSSLSKLTAPSSTTATSSIQATLDSLAAGNTPTNLPKIGGP